MDYMSTSSYDDIQLEGYIQHLEYFMEVTNWMFYSVIA